MRKVFFILIVFVLNYLFAQNFTEIDSGLPGVWGSSTDWGDYDNDGDLDIVITGETAGYPDYAPITKIFRNNSGIFSDINAGLPGLGSSSVKWGDYDNDGDLDILLAGDLEFHDYFTAIYRNDNGTFNNINAGIINIGAGDISWIDFDVDGDLDVLVCGHTSDSEVTKLYRNDLGVFNDIKADLHPSASGSASWADYDNDGDPDLLLTGQYYPYYYECNIAIIYRNDSGVFKDIQANLPGVVAGIGKWGDYDNDGDPDIILTGTGAINNYTKTSITKIYRNDLGIFTDINAGLDEVTNSHTSWGDYDNDGDLDILVNGTSEETSNLSTYLYSNDNGIFNIVNEFTGIKYGSTAWGDYDNDGDLDILLSGATGSYSNYNPVSKIFRNDSTAASNTPPTIPDGLTAVVNGFDVTLSWNRASDNETLQNGLTYNLFIGTVSQTDNVMGSMSDLQNGFRKVINQGNAYQNTSITITGIGQGTYYWGVQSIDNNFCGSDFSGISTFTSTPVLNPPVALPASDITGNAFTANLERVLGAKKYFIKVATDSLFQNYVPGYYNTDISNVEAYRVTGLEPNTDYYYKFCAYNNVLYGYSNIIHTKTSQFLDIDCGITGNEGSSIDWGDYDNDGDLDILICGKDFATVYRNDSGVFTDINAGIKILDYNSSSWGDYDNDGDLDILTTGSNYSLIYRNDSGMFTDIEAGLRGVYEGSACWGDYDYDGDLDILLTGGSTLVYRNDAGSFTDIEAGLEPVGYSSADWGDYDNDGDLDIVLSGEGHSIIYRNDNGNFIDISAGLEGTSQSSVCWGDYDCDGDLDILLCGDASNVEITKIYRNDAGSFTDINAGLYGLRLGDASWADYDNDGDLDVLISGWDGSTVHTFLYSNNLGDFTPVDTGIDKLYYTSIAWGDYDNDGDLDLVISGDERFNEVTKIYNNTADIQNTAPSAPMNPSAVVNGFDVELSWEESTDPQTPAEGLTYNIYIGTTPGTGNILNCMSDATNGQRKIAKPGNTGSLNNIVIRNISSGTYYWGVQAVDDSYMGSGFSAETSFVSNAEIIPPTALSASHIFGKSFYANWEHTTGARGYILDAAADSLFNEFVPGYEGRNVYNVSKYQVSGLEPGTEYFYRVKAYNTTPTENSNVILLKTEKLDFIDTGNILTGLRYSSADWGDYDNDGDLDIVVTGVYTTTNYFRVSEIYRNDEGVFTKIDASLPSTRSGSVKWGDYDNDGDLDLLINSFIYRNDNGNFTDINAGLKYVYSNSGAWGDYDNDGDLDVLISGTSELYEEEITKIYRNDSGVFTDINASLPGVSFGTAAWGDYDNDKDLDILICGYHYYGGVTSRIYQNNNGCFSDIDAGLLEYNGFSSGSWGDYDNDGDLDILLCGGGGTMIYRNDSGIFNYFATDIIGVRDCTAEWCDYDNDGDLDVSVIGNTGKYPDYIPVMKIYSNESSEFIDINEEFQGIYDGSIDWGDFDADGDLDLLLTGGTGSELFTKIYRNDNSMNNNKPSIPSNLSTEINNQDITFYWDRSSDDHTPQDALSYNIYIGTSSHNEDFLCSMSDLSNGSRKLARIGNTQQNNSWTIRNIPNGTYYWSVQALDQCYTGSEFANENTFMVTGIDTEQIPLQNELMQNYPNPFNPETSISYSVKIQSAINLNIYNSKGELVKNLINTHQPPGRYTIGFNAKELTSGVYFYDLNINGKTIESKKMMIIK